MVIGSAILYFTSSSWLSRTDADGLAQDAVLGHYLSKSLRKEVAPHLETANAGIPRVQFAFR